MSEVNEAAKHANHVSEVCKKITIYDVIINVTTAWERVQPQTIIKCFNKCGIPSTSINNEEITELNVQLNPERGDMPWDEYLQWKNQLEAEDPCVKPANSVDETDKGSQEHTTPDAKENGTSIVKSSLPPTIDETIKCIHDYRKECLDDPELF